VNAKIRSLQDLSALKQSLADAAALAAQRDAHSRERSARDKRERELFAHTVGPVAPLRQRARAVIERARASPVPRQRERDEAAVLREAISDEFDVETLLETDDALSYRRCAAASGRSRVSSTCTVCAATRHASGSAHSCATPIGTACAAFV